MKIQPTHLLERRIPIRHEKQKPNTGSATLIVIIILGVMTLLLTTNSLTLKLLRQEVKNMDHRQTQRLAR